MTLSSPVVGQDYAKGYAAFAAGDYATALKEWRPLAEAGDSLTGIMLGTMYEQGFGGPQHLKEAAKWYKLAVEQGLFGAQFELGVLYKNGWGVVQDYKEAVKLYKLAAEQDYPPAETNLGYIYENGQGVLQDNVMAHMWYNIGAANGKESGTDRDIIAKQMTPADISKAQAILPHSVSYVV